jgi:uncharacterized membrane protein required for colicin V production
MTAVIILLIAIIVGILYQHLQGTLLRSVITIFTIISAIIIAFSFFEQLAELLISRGNSTSKAAPYWQPIFFMLLFIVGFAVLQAVATTLAGKSVTVGPLAEKIGKLLLGAVSGFLFAAVLIITLDMTPLSNKIPYQRFGSSNPNPNKPNKAQIDPDGLIVALFGTVSKGSLAGKTSFTVVHPSFINEVFLNRLDNDKNINLVTKVPSFEMPDKAAAWPAPPGIKAADGTDVTAQTGHDLIVVRLGITRIGSEFSLSQIRLICKQKDDESLRGPAIDVYPAGYLIAADRLERNKLAENISVLRGAFKGNAQWMDFVFDVPDTHTPVLVAFKQNNIAAVPKLINTEDAPPVEPL